MCGVWNRFTPGHPELAHPRGKLSLAASRAAWVWGCLLPAALLAEQRRGAEHEHPHAPFAFLSWAFQGLINVCKVIWNPGIKRAGELRRRRLPEARQLRKGSPGRQSRSGETSEAFSSAASWLAQRQMGLFLAASAPSIPLKACRAALLRSPTPGWIIL